MLCACYCIQLSVRDAGKLILQLPEFSRLLQRCNVRKCILEMVIDRSQGGTGPDGRDKSHL